MSSHESQHEQQPSPWPKTALEAFNSSAADYEASTAGCTRDVAVDVISRLQPPVGADSVVLDNACGTGILTDVLLEHLDGPAAKSVSICAADGAANMVDLAAGRFAGRDNVRVVLATGEKLEWADDTFSHSITNLGLMFFADPVAGAREIRRTLRPGGVAVVTGWEDLGYPAVIRAVQRAVRPDDKPFDVPLPKQWFDPAHTKEVLAEGGFDEVTIESFVAHFTAETFDDLAAAVVAKFGRPCFDAWTEEQRSQGREWLSRHLEQDKLAVEYVRRDGSRAVGIEMRAIIAVARK